MDINLTEMNKRDFKALYSAVSAEYERRQQDERLKDWDKLAKAMADYCDKWGTITVTAGYIDSIHDFSIVGAVIE